jgi:predicted nucleic acid-binding protein
LGPEVIVADTNVVSYLVIEGARTASAERVRAVDRTWYVPALFVHEWLNVVTLHVKEKLMERDVALRTYHRGLTMVRVDARMPDPLEVLNLHIRSGCSSYDCQFVSLAEELGARLVTVDKEVLTAFPNIAVRPEDFVGAT